ncbi:hypothetical protein M0802_013805 [Mischocyttarus mexicanus]|nr:hypothetical protein M0802_013805 [Mischocyttarus mexicanus]
MSQMNAKGLSYNSVVISKRGAKNFVVCKRSTIEGLTKVLSLKSVGLCLAQRVFVVISYSGRILFVYSVGRLETEWMLVSEKVGPMDVAAGYSTLGGDASLRENSRTTYAPT